jgi:two-component system, OmpR family, sensor histidine kinase VanS
MPARPRGLSVRWKLTLSYAALLMVAGVLLLGVVWVFLLRYVPPEALDTFGGFRPGRYDLVRAFSPAAAWTLVFLLAFALVGGWILSGRMLAPLTRITAAARAATAGSLAHRIALEGSQDEFRELADAFDTMLGRLERQVDEQRRFAANASHELRTPLAITQTLLEAAIAEPERSDGDAALLERLLAVNARAIALTEALLLLSRAEQRAFERERVDLSLAAEEAVETLLPLAEKRGVAIEASGDVAYAAGSPAVLGQMTANLLHNAIVHNLPEGGTVWCRTESGTRSVALTVENTGEPVDAALVATLTEPFQRGTERIHADQAGVGLGLAIVKSVVTAHDGELTIAAREGGGLVATVRLPAAK